MNVRLCAFADEASPSVKTQIEVLHEEGISLIELRGLDGKNVADLTEEEASVVCSVVEVLRKKHED